MLATLGDKVDSIDFPPDHTHYPATMAAMKLGKHVYPKPLTHKLAEARELATLPQIKSSPPRWGFRTNPAHPIGSLVTTSNLVLLEKLKRSMSGPLKLGV